MLLNVLLLTPTRVILEDKAKSIIVPGEEGIFEVLGFHKRLLSRLVSGTILIDQQSFPIRRGVIKVDQNKVTIVIEESS